MFKSKALELILHAELDLGNDVAEESDWPPKCKKFVILKNRFHKLYDSDGVVYRKINDPHYWYAEYSTESSDECLACRF